MRLTPDQVSDLAFLRDTPKGVWDDVLKALEKIPEPSNPEATRSLLRSEGMDEKFVEVLLRQVFSLHGLSLGLKWSIEEVLGNLREGIRSFSPSWDEKQLANWESIEGSLLQILKLPQISGAAKALELAYEYSHLLRRSRILTDIRPIFSEDANQILGAVVGHTLRIRYQDEQGGGALSLALDDTDVKSLKDECERALQKSGVAKRTLDALKISSFDLNAGK